MLETTSAAAAAGPGGKGEVKIGARCERWVKKKKTEAGDECDKICDYLHDCKTQRRVRIQSLGESKKTSWER